MNRTSSLIPALVQQLEEAYRRQSWHGTNLRGSLRGVTREQACWRPAPERHNIWEVMVHCAYWKYTVRRRITGEKRGSFPLTGSNWFLRPVDKRTDTFKNDLRLLEEMHVLLVETVQGMKEKDLALCTATKKFTHLQVIQGIAMHDVYHAGQIQLLKRLQH